MKRPNRKPQQNNSVEKPEMTDESGARYRQQLIAAGRLTPGSEEVDEQLRQESVQQLKKLLIEQDILRPGAGLRKIKKQRPQSRRVMQ